jgi:hypothetical protein
MDTAVQATLFSRTHIANIPGSNPGIGGGPRYTHAINAPTAIPRPAHGPRLAFATAGAPMQATKRTNNATQPRASRRFELSLLELVTCRRRPMFLAA